MRSARQAGGKVGRPAARPETHTYPAGQTETDRWLGSFFNQFLGGGLFSAGSRLVSDFPTAFRSFRLVPLPV